VVVRNVKWASAKPALPKHSLRNRHQRSGFMKVKHIGMAHVKATKLIELERATVTSRGIAGDRQFILLDEAGRPLPASQHRHYLALKFHFDEVRNVLTLTYPDGITVKEDCLLSEEISDLDFLGMRKIRVRRVEGEWNDRLGKFSGKAVTMVKVIGGGGGIDVLPITLVTTGSLDDLSKRTGSLADHRRFRANLIIEHEEPFAEDGWNGKTMRIGSVALRIRSSVPRCVVTQFDPDTGVNNLRTIPTLMGFRQRVHLPDGLMPDYATPGFASYAEVHSPGAVAVGDAVSIA
jgi:uncharacterized protein YcbX